MRKLSLLCGSPWRVLSIVVPLLLLFALSEAESDTSSVTFNGSVLMADGVVDPGTVKVYLTQRAEGGRRCEACWRALECAASPRRTASKRRRAPR